jgi:hypothetical protein
MPIYKISSSFIWQWLFKKEHYYICMILQVLKQNTFFERIFKQHF